MEDTECSLVDDDGLRMYFVLKKGLKSVDDVPDDMNVAYMRSHEYFKEDENLKWITESDCLKMSTFTKKDIFVLQEFSGKTYDHLKNTESLVVGPRCVISCYLDRKQVPSNNSPVFTLAMKDLHICTSNLQISEKARIKSLVLWMGAHYYDDLVAICTHLISNSVRTKKYEEAGKNGKCIMHPNWVDDVWKKCQKENILATNQEFDKHKLPIFYDLNITSTGLSDEIRNQIKKLILEHGGYFSGKFQSAVTDIVILEKNSADSSKFKAAIKCKKECLLPNWIIDSVSKGYALPIKDYQVRRMKVSTPTKNDSSVSVRNFNPDSTELSEISQSIDGSLHTVNETCLSTYSAVGDPKVFKQSTNKTSLTKSYQDIMKQLDSFSSRDIKKAGTFLDGCRIYLTGFTVDEKEKLNKILNSGGAIRYEEINESITHVIVGEPSSNQIELYSKLQSQPQLMGIVTLNWLLESFKLRQPADENNFLYQIKSSANKEPEAPSPSSKKIINSMNFSFKKPILSKRKLNMDEIEKDKENNDGGENDENDLLQQYNPENISSAIPLKYPKSNPPNEPIPGPSHRISPPSIEPIPSTSTYQNDDNFTSDSAPYTEDDDDAHYDFFEGLAIYVHEPDDDVLHKQLIIYCEDAGGKVVSKLYKKTVDYLIVSSERSVDIKEIPVKGKNVVNTIWLEDAMSNNELVEKKYYHEPIPPTADKKPLKGLNFSFSIYTENEKVFLQSLISVLGAKASDKFMRKEFPILLCPSPEGAKYDAAIRWKYPVVNSEWLVQCAKLGERVDLHPYLVGESIVSDIWEQAHSLRNTDEGRTSPDMSNDNHIQLQSKSNEMDVDEDKNDNVHTPDNLILRHRRLSELTKKYSGRNSVLSTPTTPELNPLNLTDLCKNYSTPVRQLIYNTCKEMEDKETPPTQRLRKLIATPGKTSTPKIPDFCTTPEIEKRRMEFYNRYYIPKTLERRPETPLSEIKRRFWKQALGEHYWEPEPRSQQVESVNDELNNLPASTSSSSVSKLPHQEQSHADTQNIGLANEHIQRLSDFIKNRDSDDEAKKKQRIPDTEDELGAVGVSGDQNVHGLLQKFDSELGGTEELVGWKDPSEFLPARRRRMRYEGVPKFSISCGSDELKQQIIKKIKLLNGQICENLINYDESCTHLVCEKMNRGEKILSCIAAGKWILSVKYITDSCDEGIFLDEEEYEWGNPKSISNLPKLERNEEAIANAAFRWRTKFTTLNTNSQSNNCNGVAFNDFRCLLHVNKKEPIQKLITAGGGTVLNIKPPYHRNQDALKATHCFVDKSKANELTHTDYLELKNAGVPILSVMYLNAYLTNVTKPDLQMFSIEL